MARGGGKALVFGDPFATGGGGAPAILDLATWGTFTRTTEGSYIIGAPTTGATPFIGWSPKNVRRIDRRTGSPMLLTEGSRTNQVLSTEDFTRSGGAWTISGMTVNPTVYPHPDGAIRGNIRVQVASGTAGANYLINPVTPNLDWCASAWHRSPSGTANYEDLIGGGTVTACGSASLSTTWTRGQMLRLPDDAFGQLAYWVNDGRDWSAYGGVAAGARDSVTWGVQLEQASFPSSYMRTEELAYGAFTRAADVLSGPISTIPSKMVNGAWSFTVAPVGASSGMIRDAGTQTLFSFAEDGSETIEFYITGGACYLRVVSGGVAKVTSSALTFSADQVLAVSVDGAAGTLTISGATTGNGTSTGTAWTRTTGPNLYVGARADGSNHAFAGIWCTGATAASPSTSKRVVFTLGQSNMTQHAHHDRIAAWMQQYYPDTKLIDGSMGSTSLAVDWAKSGGTQYAAAVAIWNAAVAADPTLTGYTPVIIWIQGESDATNGTYATNYGTNLSALKTNLETDIPQLVGAKWAVGQLSTNTSTAFGASSTTIGQVRTAQANFVSGLGSQACIVDPSDLTFDAAPPNLHFDNDSIHTYAARIMTALRSISV